MNDTLTLLNGQQAAAYLHLDYRTFLKEVLKGNIGYKPVGKVKRYPIKALEQWLNNITYHTDYTSEAKSTTPTSRSYPKMEPVYSLEKLAAQILYNAPQITVSNAFKKSKRKVAKVQEN